MKAYDAKNGTVQYKPSLGALLDAAEGDAGFCLACGEEQHGIEPDARRAHCEACGANKVYGAEELMLMGLYHD